MVSCALAVMAPKDGLTLNGSIVCVCVSVCACVRAHVCVCLQSVVQEVH